MNANTNVTGASLTIILQHYYMSRYMFLGDLFLCHKPLDHMFQVWPAPTQFNSTTYHLVRFRCLK